MKKLCKENKFILIMALALLIFGLAATSFAAYTSVRTVKRVVSTVPSADTLFSSNYLVVMGKDAMAAASYGRKIVEFNQENQTPTVHISVCNYAQGYMTRWCESEIIYDMKLTLVDKDGIPITSDSTYTYINVDGDTITVNGADILNSAKYKISLDGGSESVLSGGTYTFTGEHINSDEAGRHIYSVAVDPDYVSIVYVMAEARTADNSEYKKMGLGGIVGTRYYTNQLAGSWSGRFVDSDNGYNDTKQLAGFNYEISGSGEGTYTLAWNTDNLMISGIFMNEIADYLVGSTDGQVVFKVGEVDEASLFSVQFYRKHPAEDVENWNIVNSWVTQSEFIEN